MVPIHLQHLLRNNTSSTQLLWTHMCFLSFPDHYLEISPKRMPCFVFVILLFWKERRKSNMKNGLKGWNYCKAQTLSLYYLILFSPSANQTITLHSLPSPTKQ